MRRSAPRARLDSADDTADVIAPGSRLVDQSDPEGVALAEIGRLDRDHVVVPITRLDRCEAVDRDREDETVVVVRVLAEQI